MNSTQRFTNRVDDYVKYRPSYPREVLDLLKQHIGLAPAQKVADVGCGTGISTRLFLEFGCEVFGIEPNDAMRNAAVEFLRSFPLFHAVTGSAEHTTLPNRSIDHVTAAQAFHWFEPTAFRGECQRILKPGGYVALIWNDREVQGSPFLERYEQLLLTYGVDYAKIQGGGRNADENRNRAFFAPSEMQILSVPSAQHFDFDALKGRLMSSSYAPHVGHPNHEPMLKKLWELFDATNENGRVAMTYQTVVYFGRLS